MAENGDRGLCHCKLLMNRAFLRKVFFMLSAMESCYLLALLPVQPVCQDNARKCQTACRLQASGNVAAQPVEDVPEDPVGRQLFRALWPVLNIG